MQAWRGRPPGLGAGSEPALELRLAGWRSELPVEGKLAPTGVEYEHGEKLFAEEAAEDADGQRKRRFARAIAWQLTRGYNTLRCG
jgi:hypothetical protein